MPSLRPSLADRALSLVRSLAAFLPGMRILGEIPGMGILIVSGMLGGCATTDSPAAGLRKCVWVTRYEYRTAADIERVMANCASSGFSAVMFQVRGNGTVYYNSTRELWSESYDFKSPGFDPLEVAVKAAHAHGLQLHAWINLAVGWRGEPAKADSRQLVRSRPEWFVGSSVDGGGPKALEGDYYWLNPCLPDVRRYLASICFEVAANYRVDGVHLDYVRFSDLPAEQRSRYPGDQESHDRFRKEYGADPEGHEADFEVWKTDSVTELVREIRASLDTLERRPLLTVAVWRDPMEAPARLNQDWRAWADAGLIDAILPMNYDDDDEAFRSSAEAATSVSRRVPVVVGVGVYKHSTPQQTLRQIESAFAAGADGVCMFSYGQIFGGDGLEQQERRMAFRSAISEWMVRSRPR